MANAVSIDASQKVSVLEKIGYGVGDTAANFIWRSLMAFLTIFYTDVFGLSGAAVATLLLVARFGDGIVDLIVGALADRTETRWGKFRPWVLFSIPFLAIMTVLTFTTPDFGPQGKLVWAYVTYMGLMIAYTANNIPYGAMTGVLTADPVERTSISSYRFICAFLGGLILQGTTLPLVNYFGRTGRVENGVAVIDQVTGYKSTMILFTIVGVFLFLITFFSTTERVRPPKAQKTSVKNDLADLVRNRPWVILFFVGIFFVIMTTIKQAVTVYYFRYYIGEATLFGVQMDYTVLASVFMVVGLLAAMAGTALTRTLTLHLGKKYTMYGSIVVAGVSSLLLYPLAPGAVLPIIVLSTITEFATGPIVTLFFAMLGDAADYSEWKNGRRATGLVFSAGTVAMKFGGGIGGAIVGLLLASYGYQPNVAQTETALTGLRMLISVFPAIASVALFGVFVFYTLDDKTLSRIEQDLLTRRATADY